MLHYQAALMFLPQIFEIGPMTAKRAQIIIPPLPCQIHSIVVCSETALETLVCLHIFFISYKLQLFFCGLFSRHHGVINVSVYKVLFY